MTQIIVSHTELKLKDKGTINILGCLAKVTDIRAWSQGDKSK